MDDLSRSHEGIGLEHVRDVLFRTDRDGRWHYLSPLWPRLTGHALEESLGRRVEEFIDPADRPLHAERLLTLAVGARVEALYEVRLLERGGGRRWVEICARAALDAGGAVAGTAGSLRDVTERHGAQDDQRFLGALVAQMHEAVIVVDPGFRVLKWSGGAERLFGWTELDAVGRRPDEFIAPGLGEARLSRITGEASRVGVAEVSGPRRCKDGRTVHVDTVISPLRDRSLRIEGFLVVSRDVTARRAAEAALRESDERYRSVLATMAEGLIVYDRDGVATTCNEAAARILGLPAVEICGHEHASGWAVLREDGRPLPREKYPVAATLRDGLPRENLVLGLQRDGAPPVWLLASSRTILERPGGPVAAVAVTFSDVTAQRQRTEELRQRERQLAASVAALRASEERFRILATAAPLGIFQADAAGSCLYVNPAFERLTGLPASEALGYGWMSALAPGEDEPGLARWLLSVQAGEAVDRLARFQRPTGELVWIQTWAAPHRDASGAISGYIGILLDVTGRRQTEERLAESERRLLLAMRQTQTGFFDWNFDTGELTHDPRFFSWPGIPPVLRGTLPAILAQIIAADDLERVGREVAERVDAGETHFTTEHRRPARDGRQAWVRTAGVIVERDGEGRPRRAVGTVTDITARRELEVRAAVADRLASMGTLVGGIAHELAGPLDATLASLRRASQRLLDAAPEARAALDALEPGCHQGVLDCIDEALISASRVTDVIADLRAALASDPHGAEGSCALGRAIESGLRLARHALAACASVTVDLPALPPAALALPVATQVMGSLLTNAGQATGSAPNHVRVTAAREGSALAVTIEDTGVGIPAADLPRLFDPFFTTRPALGRGLGLSVALGALRAVGGDLRVESTVGAGTRVTVLVPVA